MEVQPTAQPQPQPPQQCWSNIVKQQLPPAPAPQQQNHQSPFAAAPPRELVGSCNSTKGIAVAVVDANAIIHGGQNLSHNADHFVSVPEVLSEIRDPTSRHSLNFLPFTVDTMEPSPDALKRVINFARATGDLQTLSDVDLKLIALTYMLESQIHGTQHLRDAPPPIHTVNVRRLPEKDMPGWGSNVPNLEEWEALEHAVEGGSNTTSRILPLKDLSMNVVPTDQQSIDGSTVNDSKSQSEDQEDADGGFRGPRKYKPQKKEVKIEGKKMVADGVDASQGQYDDDAGDWLPAVSRSTHRKYLRRKARRELHGTPSESKDVAAPEDLDILQNKASTDITDGNSAESGIIKENGNEDISKILSEMRLEEESSVALQASENCASETLESNDFKSSDTADNINGDVENVEDDVDNLNEMASQTCESIETSQMDDSSSEQSWMLRSLSESTVACITSDFAMQNVILQMGLRLLAPGGMQIRELHRWVLKCHACYKVTTEIGRIFCPSCGNGGTLRKVAVTVGENGIVIAARRPRVSLRGTKFSLPLPQGGRNAITKNPILREDQLPQKFLYPKTKKKNKEGDDIFTPDNIFVHHTDKKAPLQPPMRKALAVFSGRRNPNDNHYSRTMH
ncbi:RNA-binding protein NOB1 [Ipomoea triloba]|uniref:RNA-binding protein NOB1 n=1 Tax=Ipomoea triloba TaxID=35885 RepID=UPI00125D770D|nr:RNA-binding protein NOB1 [Ipomoea triloba]